MSEHVSYYCWIPEIECKDVAKHFSYCLVCRLKYIWRAGRKNSATKIESLEKAKQYLCYEIERLKAEHNVGNDTSPTLNPSSFNSFIAKRYSVEFTP